jgi:hypothetical protein
MSPYLIAAYIILSIVLAYIGRNARLKFWGVLMASLIFSPLVVGVVLLFFGTTQLRRKKVFAAKTSDLKKK